MNALLAEAFLALHLLFGLPYPARTPQLIMATEHAMPCRHCDGAYRTGVVWMRLDQPRDARWHARLLHEARHHLQYEALGQDAASCEDWLDRERAAYTAQILSLDRAGTSSLPERLTLASLNCRRAPT